MPSRHCVANLSYVCKHHEWELAARLTGLQHDHYDLIVAAMCEELRIGRAKADMPQLIDGMIEGAEWKREIVDVLKRFSAVDLEIPPKLTCLGASGQL